MYGPFADNLPLLLSGATGLQEWLPGTAHSILSNTGYEYHWTENKLGSSYLAFLDSLFSIQEKINSEEQCRSGYIPTQICKNCRYRRLTTLVTRMQLAA